MQGARLAAPQNKLRPDSSSHAAALPLSPSSPAAESGSRVGGARRGIARFETLLSDSSLPQANPPAVDVRGRSACGCARLAAFLGWRAGPRWAAGCMHRSNAACQTTLLPPAGGAAQEAREGAEARAWRRRGAAQRGGGRRLRRSREHAPDRPPAAAAAVRRTSSCALWLRKARQRCVKTSRRARRRRPLSCARRLGPDFLRREQHAPRNTALLCLARGAVASCSSGPGACCMCASGRRAHTLPASRAWCS
jgi:hypothetical protein